MEEKSKKKALIIDELFVYHGKKHCEDDVFDFRCGDGKSDLVCPHCGTPYSAKSKPKPMIYESYLDRYRPLPDCGSLFGTPPTSESDNKNNSAEPSDLSMYYEVNPVREPETDDLEAVIKEVLRHFLSVGQTTVATSYLQRKFRLGYNLAAKIMDTMEERGFVGPLEDRKPRAVLITREKFREIYGEDV